MTGFGTTVCNAHRHFPDIVGKEHIYKAPAWLFGCHPYHNYSWVAAVGAARPKQVFYGNNRADFSFIPGNMAPGRLALPLGPERRHHRRQHRLPHLGRNLPEHPT